MEYVCRIGVGFFSTEERGGMHTEEPRGFRTPYFLYLIPHLLTKPKFTMKKYWKIILISLPLLFGGTLSAQPATQFVKVMVAPDHADWNYKIGEPVTFKVTVLKDGNPLKDIQIKYEVGPEKMEPMKRDSLLLPNGSFSVPSTTLKKSWILTVHRYCKAGWKRISRTCSCGV